MKALLMTVLALGFSVSAFSFADTVGPNQIAFGSVRQTNDGAVRTLEGTVKIETPNLVIRADKATFNSETLDILPIGHVRITLKQ